MRLTTVILIASLLQVSAATYSQRITIKRKSAPLESILNEIQKQSGYDFIYSRKIVKEGKKLDVSISSVSVEEALKVVLAGLPLTYKIENQKVSIVKKDEPSFLDRVINGFSAIDIRGIILDNKGNPLPGATINVKGGNKRTVTDEKGRFSIAGLKPNDVLVVTYIGYEQVEVALTSAGNGELTIRLKIATGELSEVAIVNTGYQQLSKERSPGTIAHLGQEILAKRPATDLSAALDGVVAGMQAVQSTNGNNSFIIRGISTLDRSNNQRLPLIVVDGFPLASADFSTINPNDVESVDVLKDAAAAAVWGARSTNGVIVITTKRGTGKQGLSIDGSAFVRVADRPDLNQITTTGTSAQSVAYEKQAVANKFYSSTPYQGGIFPSELTRPITLAQEFIYNNMFRGLPAAAMNASLDSLSSINNREQIQDYLLQRTVTQQYNVNLHSNTDRSKSYASLLFENNQDRFIGNGYKKFAINFANEYKIAKFLTFNFNAFVQYNDATNNGATLAELRSLSPYETLINPDGNYSPNLNTYNRYILSQLPLSKFPYSDLSYNLLREVRGRDLETENYYARLQAGFSLKIIPGLALDSKVQYERGKTDVSNYYSDDTFYVRQMIDNFTAYNNTTKTVGVSLLPKGGINQTQNNNVDSYNFRSQLNFIKDISKFSINAALGGEISQARSQGRINPWQYGYNPATQSSVVPPYGYGSSADTFVGSTITGGNTSSLNGGTTTQSYGLDRFVSYFGASNITYNNKYTITLNIRGDASNYITSIPSLRWSPFWSVGGNWDMKAEKFMEDINWLNYLHLRASYGSTGTANKSTSTEALLAVGTAPNAATGTITANVSSYGNPFLKWERTYITNLAVDFGLFSNKLSGSVNLYNKSGKGITGTANLPAAYGTTVQTFNSADLVNKGIEIQLGTSLQLPAGFGYSTSLNYAYNWNQITKLYYPNQFNVNLTMGAAFVQGKPVNSYYTYKYAGVNSLGQPLIEGANGTKSPISNNLIYASTDGLTGGYMNYAGTLTPPHTMGWRHTVSYHNLSLTAQFTGTFGATFLKPTFTYGTFVGNDKTIVSRFVDQPTQGGPGVIPFPSAADAGSGVSLWPIYTPYLAHNIESSSYVQLKELMLDYDLPQSVLGRSKLRNVSVFLQGRNLGMIWVNNKYNYNPDFLPGTDRPVATFTFGAKFGL